MNIDKILETIDIEVFWNRMNAEFKYVGLDVDLYRRLTEDAFINDKQWVVEEWIDTLATPQELRRIQCWI